MSQAHDPAGGHEGDADPGAAEAAEVLRRTAERLADLDGRDVADHVAVFDAVQRDLTEVLRGLDDTEDPAGSERA
jgi:hypothetical protein